MTESQNTGKEDFLDLSVLVLPLNPVAVFLGLFRGENQNRMDPSSLAVLHVIAQLRLGAGRYVVDTAIEQAHGLGHSVTVCVSADVDEHRRTDPRLVSELADRNIEVRNVVVSRAFPPAACAENGNAADTVLAATLNDTDKTAAQVSASRNRRPNPHQIRTKLPIGAYDDDLRAHAHASCCNGARP